MVPVAVREGIAQALPGFTTSGAAGGGAASGAVGLGLLAKLTGGPVALKIAAGVVAVTATGSVAVVGAEKAGKPQRASADAPAAFATMSAGVGIRLVEGRPASADRRVRRFVGRHERAR